MTLAVSAVPWYAARASGIVAFTLLTLATLAGLLLAGRARLAPWPRFAVEDVHGYLGLLAGVFIGLHGLSLLVDRYISFSLVQLLVPGASSYRPLATALGIVAAELLAALALTNRYRNRLPYRFWRRAHYLTFVVWLLALVHGLAVGTDRSATWGFAVYLVSAGSVAFAIVWRALNTAPSSGATARAG